MKLIKKRMKVSHFAQVPCTPFEVQVNDETQAKWLIDILANQHLFLEKEHIIPDYSNVILVSMWDEDADGQGNAGWIDYYNDEEEMEWDEFEEAYLEDRKPIILSN